jgi:hypothetical protein
MGCGQPVLGECVPARPCHPVALTTSAPRLTPRTHDGVAQYREQAPMARHSRVSIMPHQHACPPGPLLRDRPMHAPAQCVLHGLQCLAKPLGHRLTPDRTLAVPRFPAYMRQAKKVKGLRFALSPPLAPFSSIAPTRNQPRLLRLELQIDLSQTVPQCFPEPCGVVPVCAAYEEGVSVAYEDAIPACRLTPPSVSPYVQDVGQGEVGRQGAQWSRDSAHLHDSHRACFTILLPQTKRDSFPALRFPALQTSMVTLRGRLHMAGSAQAFGVVAGLLSTVATGRPVMKIEVHRCAAALTPCSTFCLHLCLACAPALLMLGLAQPGMLRAWGVAWRNLGLPVLAQRGIVRCAGPVFRPRLSAHPVEEEHGVAMLEAHVIPGALFAVFVHRHDAVGRTPMSLLQPTEHALIDPAIEGCDDGRGIAVAVIGAPAPQDRVECTQLEPRSLPTPSSRRHCPDGGLQALWGFVTRCDQPCRSVLAIDRASSRKTEDMEAVVHLRDVRLFHGAFALQCFCEESRKRLPPTIGLLVAAMGQHEPSIRLSDERTVALIGLPATLLPRAVEAAVVGPPMQVQLVPIDICEHGRAYSPYKVANFFFRGPHRQGTDRPETRY